MHKIINNSCGKKLKSDDIQLINAKLFWKIIFDCKKVSFVFYISFKYKLV